MTNVFNLHYSIRTVITICAFPIGSILVGQQGSIGSILVGQQGSIGSIPVARGL